MAPFLAAPNIPFLNEDVVGDLPVLIAKSRDEFLAYVLDYDEDIEQIQSALGVEPFESWGVYLHGAAQPVESEDDCIDRQIREFSATLTSFPAGDVFPGSCRGEAEPTCRVRGGTFQFTLLTRTSPGVSRRFTV
jgi:hypothetical protein